MNLLLSAGEASGDLHGARLFRAIVARRPDCRAFGMGGGRLVAEGLESIVRSEKLSVVGVFEVFEKLPVLTRALATLGREARRRRPDAAVLIDFPDFHSLLARRLEREGIPVIYYVSPQVWAWRPGRARVIARTARRIVTFFPFEAEIYRQLGADVVCAGHPLVDDVREGLDEPSPLPPKARRRLVLVPGSRSAEVRHHWKPMLAAAQALRRRFDLELAAMQAPGLPDTAFPGAAERGVPLVSRGRYSLLASSDLAFVASGTATLEAAICRTPMIVVYKTSAATFAIGKRLVRVPWISLVNIVAAEEIVPELLQGDVDPARLEREGAALLESPERVARMRLGLDRVARTLGPGGASRRAAEAILEAVDPNRRSTERRASQ